MATTEVDAEKAQVAAELAAATAQRDALKPKADQGVEQWTQQGQHAQDVAQGAVTQAYDAQGELLKQAPGEANLPEAKPPTINPDDYQGLTYALIGMAMISGAAKGDWMSASSSLNGAMKGIVEGNAQKADEYWKKYQADYKRASDKHNDAMREYDNKVRQSDLTINQRLSAAQEVARRYEHLPINVAADQKSLTEVEKHIDSLRSAETRLAESHDRVATQAETARQARLERQQAHADLQAYRWEDLRLREQKAGAKQHQFGPTAFLEETLGGSTGDKKQDKEIADTGRAVVLIDDLEHRLQDPQIRTGMATALNSINQRIAQMDNTKEIDSGTLNTLINGAVTGTDKNSVFQKDALFAAFAIERAAQGGRLTVQMMKQAGSVLDPTQYTKEAYAAILGGRRQQLVSDLRENRLSDEDIAKLTTPLAQKQPDIGAPGGAPRPAAPKAGAVESGYRFKGGDPADKNNWVRVQ
jgi:hypothetical protein